MEDQSTTTVPPEGTTSANAYTNTTTSTTTPQPLSIKTEKPLPTCPKYLNDKIRIPCWLLKKGTCYCLSTFRASKCLIRL